MFTKNFLQVFKNAFETNMLLYFKFSISIFITVDIIPGKRQNWNINFFGREDRLWMDIIVLYIF